MSSLTREDGHEGGRWTPKRPHMLIKRSVSPDGRIDSLSVQFSVPIHALTSEEVTARAESALALQDAIAQRFLGRNRGGEKGNRVNHSEATRAASPNGTHPAQLVRIERKKTRFGLRQCLVVDVAGDELWVFGGRRKLENLLAQAGYTQEASATTNGGTLNLPCRVSLRQDGQYTRVEQIFPPEAAYR